MGLINGRGTAIPTGSSGVGGSKSKTYNPANKLNPQNMSVGWVNTTVGGSDTLNTANVNTRTTEAIAVSAGQIVSMGYITAYSQNPFFVATSHTEWCLAYAFFNSSGVVVSGATSRPTVTGGITVPSGASYVRVTFFNNSSANPVSNPEKFYVYVSSENVTEPTYYFTDDTETLSAEDSQLWNLWGKTWVMFGDSHVDAYYGEGWVSKNTILGYQYDYASTSTLRTYYIGDLVQYDGTVYRALETNSEETFDSTKWEVASAPYCVGSRIARDFGLIMDNRGYSGTNLDDGANPATGSPTGVDAVNTLISEIEAGTTEMPDIITISFGTNGFDTHIGTSSDTSSTTTTAYGATKYIIEQLRTHCPNSAVGFILPPKVEWEGGEGGEVNSSGRAPKAYREAMLAVLNDDDYRVPYIDMWTDSGITFDMEHYGNGDGIHPFKTEQLRELYYHALKGFMTTKLM